MNKEIQEAITIEELIKSGLRKHNDECLLCALKDTRFKEILALLKQQSEDTSPYEQQAVSVRIRNFLDNYDGVDDLDYLNLLHEAYKALSNQAQTIKEVVCTCQVCKWHYNICTDSQKADLCEKIEQLQARIKEQYDKGSLEGSEAQEVANRKYIIEPLQKQIKALEQRIQEITQSNLHQSTLDDMRIKELEAQKKRLMRTLNYEHPEKYPDNCEICKGANSGVRGNENIVNKKVVCDYCSVEIDEASKS